MISTIKINRDDFSEARKIYSASQIILSDGRILENVIKDIEESVKILRQNFNYTYVIHNQEEFDDWIKRYEGNNYEKVLIMPGVYEYFGSPDKPELENGIVNLLSSITTLIGGFNDIENKTIIKCYNTAFAFTGSYSGYDVHMENICFEMHYDKPVNEETITCLESLKAVKNVDIKMFIDEHVKTTKIYGFYNCSNITSSNIYIKESLSEDTRMDIIPFMYCRDVHGNKITIEHSSTKAVVSKYLGRSRSARSHSGSI